MTKAETAALLTLIAAFDRRTIGETDVEAWHLVLADLNAEDCGEAVRQHFTSSTAWLMPAEVRRLAVTTARRRIGTQKEADRQRQIEAANTGEISDRAQPLRALMAGSSVKATPRPDWQQRHALPPRPSKPPLTTSELAAARDLMTKAAADPTTGEPE
jgi:hypothetical protein